MNYPRPKVLERKLEIEWVSEDFAIVSFKELIQTEAGPDWHLIQRTELTKIKKRRKDWYRLKPSLIMPLFRQLRAKLGLKTAIFVELECRFCKKISPVYLVASRVAKCPKCSNIIARPSGGIIKSDARIKAFEIRK